MTFFRLWQCIRRWLGEFTTNRRLIFQNVDLLANSALRQYGVSHLLWAVVMLLLIFATTSDKLCDILGSLFSLFLFVCMSVSKITKTNLWLDLGEILWRTGLGQGSHWISFGAIWIKYGYGLIRYASIDFGDILSMNRHTSALGLMNTCRSIYMRFNQCPFTDYY